MDTHLIKILTDYAEGKISKNAAQAQSGFKKAAFNSRMRQLGYSSESHYFPGKPLKPLIPKNDQNYWKLIHDQYKGGASLEELADNLGIRSSTVKERFSFFGFSLRSENQNRKQAIVKMRAANLLTLGVESPQQSKLIQNKTKATVQAKYGVDNVSQTKIVRQKISAGVKASSKTAVCKRKQTNLSVYGVPFPQQLEDTKDKIKATNLSRYGHSSAAASPEVRLKIESTNIEKYGVKSPLSIPEVYDKRFTDEFKAARILTIRNKQTQKILTRLSFHGYELLEPYLKLADDSGWIKYKIKHLVCNTVFEDDLLALPRCLKCFHIHKRSFAENLYYEFVKGISPTAQAGVKIDGVNVDIWIPELKIGFEYNGLYWHSVHKGSPKNRQKPQYHWNKTKSISKSGGALIHIWEHDDPEIVKSRISLLLGKSSQKFYARNLLLKSVSVSEANEFFEQNHLDGATPNQIRAYGLFNDTEMVSCLTVRNRKEHLEVARFASKLNTSVVAGFSKILTKVKADFPNRTILSYANTDWTPNPENSVYAKTGFNLDGHTGPSLKFTDFSDVYSRETFQKHKLKDIFPDKWDAEISATALLASEGIYPIYGSGNWRFLLKI